MLADAFNNMLDRLTGELKGQTRVHRRRVARAAHADHRDPRPARGARRADRPVRRGRPPHRGARAARDHPHQPPGRRPAAARPQAEHTGLPAARADRAAHVRRAALGRHQPDRRSALRARPGARRARSSPTPTGWPRRCATWRATRSSRPPQHAGSCRLEVDRARAGAASASRSSTTGPGIPVAERERVFERFHRTDPARSRAGRRRRPRARDRPRDRRGPPRRGARLATAAGLAGARIELCCRASSRRSPHDRRTQPVPERLMQRDHPTTTDVDAEQALPPDDVRLSDERARLRADQGDARVARLRRGRRRATTPT